MSRWNWRSVASLLLVSLLAGCSAGQITQTSTQERDKTGGFGQVGDITVRAVRLAYPTDGVYRPGDSAAVRMAIVNRGPNDDALVSITGSFFTGVTVSEPTTTSKSNGPDSTATDPSAANQPVARSTFSAMSTSKTTDRFTLPIPADDIVLVGSGGPALTLTGLTERFDAAHSQQLTLSFARAGQVTVTAIVDTPAVPLPRTPVITF